jgi:hypothetical protein
LFALSSRRPYVLVGVLVGIAAAGISQVRAPGLFRAATPVQAHCHFVVLCADGSDRDLSWCVYIGVFGVSRSSVVGASFLFLFSVLHCWLAGWVLLLGCV